MQRPDRRAPIATQSPLRLSLTLSGGASLGAYEAGAVAGVLIAVRHLAEQEGLDATVDAIGGASAGSIVGLCAAHCLLEGLDPVHVMRAAWVDGVSLALLRAHGTQAPLSFEALRERVPELLDPRDSSGAPAHRRGHQESGLTLHVSLTGLQGLTYPIAGLRDDRPVDAATYADWRRFELEPRGGLEQLLEPTGSAPLDFVLASSAHPGGFAPRLLDRSADAEGYRRRGIESFPDSGRLWYTDGGLLQSQPVGRVLAAADRPERAAERAHHLNVLIDPRSEAPSASVHWSDPELDPTWQAGLARALAILPAQILYDDLRRIEKDNSRLRWLERLVQALGPRLDDRARDALRELVAEIDSDREGGRADEPDRDRARADADGDPAALLRRAVAEIAGLVGKRRVEVDVISPLVVADESGDVAGLLAGELIGDFGGFLSRDLRASDFALGYESALAWTADALCHCGVPQPAARRAAEKVARARPFRCQDVDRGEAGLGDLPLRARLELGRVALQAVRVLAAGAIDVRSRLPDPLGRALDRARATLRSARR